MNKQAKFSIGQIVHHKLFNYRGVIFEIDPEMMLGDEWYDQVAKSRPPKNEPWYHVLVDNAAHTTYVAQQNLEPGKDSSPIDHPDINNVFEHYVDGSYLMNKNKVQ
jgi:heat shock protein HspQ